MLCQRYHDTKISTCILSDFRPWFCSEIVILKLAAKFLHEKIQCPISDIIMVLVYGFLGNVVILYDIKYTPLNGLCWAKTHYYSITRICGSSKHIFPQLEVKICLMVLWGKIEKLAVASNWAQGPGLSWVTIGQPSALTILCIYNTV